MTELGIEPGLSSSRAHGRLLVMLHLKWEYYFPRFRSYASIYVAYNDFSFFLTAHIKLLTHRAPFIMLVSPNLHQSMHVINLTKNLIKEKDYILFKFNVHFFECCRSSTFLCLLGLSIFLLKWLVYIVCPLEKLAMFVFIIDSKDFFKKIVRILTFNYITIYYKFPHIFICGFF